MFLDQGENDYVLLRYSKWVSEQGSPREAIITPLLNTTFTLALGEGPPLELAMKAIHLCLDSGWQNSPPWLYLLLGPAAGFDATIRAVRDRILNPPVDTQASSLAQSILNDGTPFVNRHDLRDYLEALHRPATDIKPILVVSGEGQIGKSHSLRYIEHFSSIKKTIIPNKVVFDPELAADMGSAEIAKRLVLLMGRPLTDMPPHHTNNLLYVEQLAIWVLHEATRVSRKIWFVFDNFKGEKLTVDTRNFIVALSSGITNGVFPQFCRLILIAFDRAYLKVEPEKVEAETIRKCSKEDVDKAITEILFNAPANVDRNKFENFVFPGLKDHPEKMKLLNFRLRALNTAVTGVKKILKGHQDINFEDVVFEILKDVFIGDSGIEEIKRRIGDLRDSVQEI